MQQHARPGLAAHRQQHATMGFAECRAYPMQALAQRRLTQAPPQSQQNCRAQVGQNLPLSFSLGTGALHPSMISSTSRQHCSSL